MESRIFEKGSVIPEEEPRKPVAPIPFDIFNKLNSHIQKQNQLKGVTDSVIQQNAYIRHCWNELLAIDSGEPAIKGPVTSFDS